MNKIILTIAMFVSTAVAAFGQSELMARSNEITAAQSSDRLKINGVAQVRYVFSNSNSDAYGFEVPMLRMDLYGDLGSGFDYRVSPRVDGDGEFTLENAFVGYKIEQVKDLKVKFGQFRPQFVTELNGNSEDIVAATHSVVANTLGQTFTQGAEFSWSYGVIDASVAFTDGVDRANTPVDSTSNNYGVIAKIDAEIFDGFKLGAGINHEDDFDTYLATAAWQHGKFSAAVDYLYSDSESVFESAAVGTIAYECFDNLQPFITGEWAQVEGGEDLAIVTGGVNYYMAGKTVKWTNQVGYTFNAVDAAWNVADTGWVAGGDDGEMVAISQLQIKF
jgi:hypothetical protein